MWCLLFANDFVYLCNNYDSIDFRNAKLKPMSDADDIGSVKHHIEKKIYGIEIDNKITAWFTHSFFDPECKEPIKREISNIYYCKNDELVLDNYNRRIDRMLDSPIFTAIAYHGQCWTKEAIDNIKSKYPVYILTDIQGCESTDLKHIEYVDGFIKYPWADFEGKVDSWKVFIRRFINEKSL